MTMYFVLSSFGIKLTAVILFFLTVYVLLGPHMLDMQRNVLASVGIDSVALESGQKNLQSLLEAQGIDPSLSPEEWPAQRDELKEALEEWAAQQEEFKTKALVAAGQTGVGPEQAAKNIQETMAMEMLPYMALCVLVYLLLSSGVFFGWLKGFLFRRDFYGYRLELRGKRGAVELTTSRLGQIAWALAWRWILAWCAFFAALSLFSFCMGFLRSILGFGCRVALSGPSFGGILSLVFFVGILIYTFWRICTFLVESLLKVEFSDFKVVFAQNIDRDMMHQIREDLFKQAPVPTMRFAFADA